MRLSPHTFTNAREKKKTTLVLVRELPGGITQANGNQKEEEKEEEEERERESWGSIDAALQVMEGRQSHGFSHG